MKPPADGAEWHIVTLGDHVDLLTGFPFKSALFTRSNKAIRLLKGSVVSPGALDWSGSVGWPIDDMEPYAKFSLEAGDVVLAMDRPWLEAGLKYAWVTEGDLPCLLVQRVARLRGRSGLETAFLRYVVASPAFTNYIAPIVTGINVPHISPRQICSFQFLLPPLPIQRKIAGILSAYDHLIENNNHRIKILEEMAQRIYREWFVDFRYPGHEGVPLVDSELGPIPEGWHVAPLSALCQVNARTLKNLKGFETIQYIDISSVEQGTINYSQSVSAAAAPGRARRQVVCGDVIWSTVRPNRRAFALLMDPSPTTIVSTGFAVLSAQHVPTTYLYALASSEAFVEYLVNHATGSAYPAVTGNTFEEMPVVLPDAELLGRYDALASPALSLAAGLRSSAGYLRAARDLLLPRLISGQIDVENLNIPVEEAA